MFHALAHLFRPGTPDMQLYNTGLEDIVAVHGLLFPMTKLDSEGVRITVASQDKAF